MSNIRFFTLTLIFLCLVFSISAQTLLQDYMQEENLQLYWDELANRGILWRGSEMIGFMLNFPAMSRNLNEMVSVQAPYMGDQGIMLPQQTVAVLNNFFALTRSETFREVSKIFIDPGHGGRDPGTIGRLANGEPINEKDIVLQVAVQLAQLLRQAYPDKDIILSRDSDFYLTLEERTEMANGLTNGPDEKILFVSIHANAALSRNASGFEVWYLPPEYRRQVLDASDVDDESGSVLPILNSILEEEYTVESILLAQSIERGLGAQIGQLSESRGLKEMDWYVVRRAYMPSVLIELGFVTNPTEVELLNNPVYLQNLSQGIYNGLTEFIQDFESVSQ